MNAAGVRFSRPLRPEQVFDVSSWKGVLKESDTSHNSSAVGLGRKLKWKVIDGLFIQKEHVPDNGYSAHTRSK